MSDVEDLGPLPYASRVEAMAGYGLSPLILPACSTSMSRS